jgi:hypothetical protein
LLREAMVKLNECEIFSNIFPLRGFWQLFRPTQGQQGFFTIMHKNYHKYVFGWWVPRQQRREECIKALKCANARERLASSRRENAPTPVKELIAGSFFVFHCEYFLLWYLMIFPS